MKARVVSLAREAAAAANEAADSGAEDEGSADELAEAALGLWVGTVLAQPHLLQTFFHVMTDDVEGFTFDTLFCKSKMIRREAAHSLRGATGAVGGGGGAARELGRGWYGAAQGPGGLTVPRARFLALLLAELPRVGGGGGGGGGRAECDQYFDLLTALVSDTIEATENAGDDSENNWGVRLVDGTFVNELVQRLLDHPTTEKRGSNKEDKLLVGLMKLIVVIISKVGALRGPVGARLVGPLFAEFLFAPPAPRGGGGDNGGVGGNGGGRRAGGEGGEGGAAAEAPPKCKTQASRAAAYELLAAVCRGSRANLERVLADGLAPLLARVDRLARWDYRPSGQERASSGFVGMRNLGNVCYLNSTMQQLFLNEKFRNAIFSCEDPADAKEESVLTQLQLLFGHLQLSERQAANPRGLCNSIKDWDGMPIDVSIQQDAQSFLLQFRDKLEEAMKGTPQEDAFKRAYCGQLVNQLIYKGEVRERLEEFTCISLEVKNMKGVADAFDKFISKDTIEGFSWEEKGPGVDVQKRAVLGTLPPSVILHLNRFTMNMDTFMTEKLNTRFEFPMRLNLEPYTKEGVERREAAQAAEGGSGGAAAAIEGGGEGAAPPAPGDNGNVAYSLHPREYYEYELVGVQVHYGTANQGHYYSFARDRKGGGGGDGDGDGQGKPKWYEFNDSLVRSWNISNLEMDCFGGSSASQWTTKDRISNAYLLFYDRVKPKLALPATPPALPAAGAGAGAGEEGAGGAPAPSTAVQASVGAVRAAAKFKGNLKKAVSKRGQSDGTVPENVFQEVWHDNDKFSFDRQVYHHDFFKFVSSFLDSTKTSLEGDGKELTEFGKSCVKFGTSFLFDVIAHAYDNDSLKDSVETLTTFFKWAPEEAAKYLDNVAIKGDMEEARELLLECKDKHVRAQYRGFLAALLAALGPAEAPRYLDAEDAPPPPSEGGGGAAAGGEEAAPRRRPATATARFLDGLLALLPGAAKEWARIEQFAQVFEVMANLGPEAREMMLARRVLAHLLDFFLRDKSPFVREGEKRTAMGNKMYSPRLGPLVRAAAALVQHALAAPAAPGGGATTGRPAAEALGEAERLCLESEAFYELALEEDQDPRAVGQVLCAVFRGDEPAAARFSRFILKGLDDATYEGVRPYMALMREWLALDDGLQPLRIELVMGRPLEKDDGGLLKSMWDNRLRYERWLYKILFSLADMLLEIEPLGAYVAAIGEEDAAGPQAGGGAAAAAAGSAPAQDRYCEWLLKFAARTFMGLNRPGWVDTQECAAVGDKLARWERRHHGASGLERQRLAAARQGGAAELDCNASSGVVVSVVEHYPPKEEGQDERKGEEEANALVWKVKNNRLEKIRFTLTMEVAEGDDPNYVLPNGPVVLEVEAQSSAEVYRARRAAPGGGGWRLARYRWAFELAEGVAAPDIGEADPVAAMQRRQRQAQRAAGGGGGAAATGGVASYAVAVGTGGDDMMMYDSLMDDGYAADVVWDDMD